MRPTQQPQNHVLASNVLLWGGVALPLAVTLFKAEVLHKESFLYWVKDLAGGLVLLLALAYAIRAGQAWPKWLLLGMFILFNVLNLADRDSLLHSLRADRLSLLTFITGNVVLLWVLMLLFKRPRPH